MDYNNYRAPSAQQQQQYGGYPPYNAHVHAPPPPPTHHAQHAYGYNAPPQPAPVAPADPFRAYYASRLRDLTFNSRPIIQDLSMMAMQQRDAGNWANMQAVVEEIETAVLRAQVKLPMLYLIDSISKNVGAPYTTDLLRPVIPRLYVKTYKEVDGVTKSKMEEMISLWRTSGPGRTDLYGPDVRMAVEREIFGSTGPHPNQPPRQVLPTREVVVQTLRSTLDAKQRESAGKPWDATLKHQIGVLQAIGELLNSSQVPAQDLQHIMEQLRSMAPVPPPAPPAASAPTYQSFTPNPAAPGPPAANLPPFPLQLSSNGNYRSTPPIMPPMPPTLGTPSHNTGTPILGSSTPIPGQTPAPLPAPTAIPSGIPSNVADILRNLNASGFLSNPRTPETAPASLPAKTALDNYEEMILSMDMRLDSLDLNRINTIPTSHLPQRCKQCGIRFADGDAKMQAHLDWHFRRNKQNTGSSGRGAHRRWLPKAEDWVVDLASNNDAGPSTSRTEAPAAGGAGANKLSAEQLARYAARKVRAPQDPIKAGKPCPVCKEAFKAELEDDEWIFRNAIEVGGVIYHATCRAEQMNARKNAKLLHPNGRLSGSPRLTPQPGETEVKVEQRQSPMKAVPAIAAAAIEGKGEGAHNIEKFEDAATSAKRKAADEQVDEEENKRVKVEPGAEGNMDAEDRVETAEPVQSVGQPEETAEIAQEEAMGSEPGVGLGQSELAAAQAASGQAGADQPPSESTAPKASTDGTAASLVAPSAPFAAGFSLTDQLQSLAGLFPQASSASTPAAGTPLEAPSGAVPALTTTEPLDLDVDDEALYGSDA